MPKIATILSDEIDGEKSISLLLTRDALFLDPDGIPSPGIALSPAQARMLAERLMHLADQANVTKASENPARNGSIFIVHDGTARGDRAFDLALTMAENSSSPLHLYVDAELSNDHGDVVEACAAQLGAMQRISARCSTEAARRGVRMKPCTLGIGNPRENLVAPDSEMDFVIIPHGPDSQKPLPTNIGRYIILVR